MSERNPKGPLSLHEPLDLDDARRQAHAIAKDRRGLLQDLQEKVQEFAKAEKAYRVAYSKKLIDLRDEGTPTTIIADVARGDEKVIDLRCARDVAEQTITIVKEQLAALNSENAALGKLTEWSARVQAPPAPDGETHGRGLRAA